LPQRLPDGPRKQRWGRGGLIVLRGLIETYGVEPTGLMQGVFAAPIAVQEMGFATWLIVKGFDTSGLPGSGVEKRARREFEGLATTEAPV
jgi:hypothetical protein